MTEIDSHKIELKAFLDDSIQFHINIDIPERVVIIYPQDIWAKNLLLIFKKKPDSTERNMEYFANFM